AFYCLSYDSSLSAWVF
nr:immunoglobulin light chain junction region [Macaca mulatta]MOV95701.1 immunoglobulin light chain junction region [Macaca mulatta]